MELPTRKQAGYLAGATRNDSRLGPISWPILNAYADATLMTRQEWVDSAVKVTTWDFTCNSELTEGYCDVCEMDDTVDYGPVVVTRSVAALGKDTEG